MLIVIFRFIAQQGLSHLRHIAIILSSPSASCIFNVVYFIFLKTLFHIGSIHIGLIHHVKYMGIPSPGSYGQVVYWFKRLNFQMSSSLILHILTKCMIMMSVTNKSMKFMVPGQEFSSQEGPRWQYNENIKFWKVLFSATKKKCMIMMFIKTSTNIVNSWPLGQGFRSLVGANKAIYNLNVFYLWKSSIFPQQGR